MFSLFQPEEWVRKTGLRVRTCVLVATRGMGEGGRDKRVLRGYSGQCAQLNID